MPSDGITRPMCGRIGFTRPKQVQPGFFGLDALPDLHPRYNIAPSQSIAAIRQGNQGRELVYLKWGLIPSWAKDPKDAFKSINARAETVATKPSFRAAFKQRRCLILADCFYEWRKDQDGGKQPYCIRLPDAGPIPMAGLWEHWESDEGEILESGAIITTTANEQMQQVHDRMPVILSPSAFGTWLDPQNKDTAALATLLVPFTGRLHLFPVSRMVNNPRNDDPRCLEPAA